VQPCRPVKVWKDIVGIFVSLNNLHGRYKFNYLLKVMLVYTSILYYEDEDNKMEIYHV
jgi:hypothetical protein